MASKRPNEYEAVGCVKRKRSQESFLAPFAFNDKDLADETFTVAKTKEEQFFLKVCDIVIPASFLFTESINYMTVLHCQLELPREVLFLSIDVLLHYLSKRGLSLRGNRVPKRISCACILLAAKFNQGEGINFRKKISTKSKVRPNVLVETERQVFCAIEYRFNWWNDYYFLTYYASKSRKTSSETNLAELVLLASHHSRKIHRIKGSVNAAVCLNIATEIIAFSGSRGVPLKRKRPDAIIFDPVKEGLVSRPAELAKCKRRIIRAIEDCKRKETPVYDLLLDECYTDPVEVLQRVVLDGGYKV